MSEHTWDRYVMPSCTAVAEPEDICAARTSSGCRRSAGGRARGRRRRAAWQRDNAARLRPPAARLATPCAVVKKPMDCRYVRQRRCAGKRSALRHWQFLGCLASCFGCVRRGRWRGIYGEERHRSSAPPHTALPAAMEDRR